MKPLTRTDPPMVGDYTLLARLGAGGMGRVYLGRSPGGRRVAVKVVRPELADDEVFRARFGREVAAARAVSGFYTAPVIDADPTADVPWLATAYVEGPDLRTAVDEAGPLPAEAVRSLAAGLAEALGAIHRAGLVHRDLKPSNVLLAADGPRVIDFGIARALDATALTREGVIGSVGFMSPEHLSGGDVGPPSDVFSLASTLVFAATGGGPFGQDTPAVLFYRIISTPPELAGVPAALRELVARCLAKEPAARPTPRQILTELAAAGTAAPDRGWLPDATTRMLADSTPPFPRDPAGAASPPGTGAGGTDATTVPGRSGGAGDPATTRLSGPPATRPAGPSGTRLSGPSRATPGPPPTPVPSPPAPPIRDGRRGHRLGWLPAAVAGLVAAVLLVAAAAVFWPDGDSGRDADAGNGGASRPLPGWTFQLTTDDYLREPVVAGDAVYSGSDDGTLYAVDAATGKKTAGVAAGGKWQGTPVAADGVVYAGNTDGHLYAVSAADGGQRWKVPTDGPAGAPVVGGDRVVVPAGNRTLHAFDVEGRPLWRRTVGNITLARPALVGDRLYVGSAEPFGILVLDAGTGRTLDVLETVEPVETAVTVVDGVVYATTGDPNRKADGNELVYAFIADGREKWRFATGAPNRPPVVAGGRVYVTSADGFLYALERSTGTEVWRYRLHADLHVGEVVLGDGLLYLPDDGLRALDPGTGRQRWHNPLDGTPTGRPRTPALAGGRVVVATDDMLVALDAKTGR